MNLELVAQIAVGLGMIGGMWRLTTQVASIAEGMRHYSAKIDDHEARIRELEHDR